MQCQETMLLLEDQDCIISNSGGLDEAKWPGQDFFQFSPSVGSLGGR